MTSAERFRLKAAVSEARRRQVIEENREFQGEVCSGCGAQYHMFTIGCSTCGERHARKFRKGEHPRPDWYLRRREEHRAHGYAKRALAARIAA